MSTLAISRPPTTMFWSCDGIWSAVNAVCRQPSTATATITPAIVPRPPKIEMPPSRTIVTTKSSIPTPESWRADAGDEEAVDRAEERTEDDGHDHRQPDRPAVLEELGHEHTRQAEDRRDREVDLPGDDDQGEWERHDRDLAHVQADVEEVRRL